MSQAPEHVEGEETPRSYDLCIGFSQALQHVEGEGF
jgi:hypothetical protein